MPNSDADSARRRVAHVAAALSPASSAQRPPPPPFAQALRNNPEVTAPVELAVRGELPTWLRGVLYRAGPGTYDVELSPEAAKKTGRAKHSISHWFDGLSQIHRFEITPDQKVLYRNRNTAKGVEELIRREGGLPVSFGQETDPCVSLLGRFMSFYSRFTNPQPPASKRPVDSGNVGVTVSPDFPIPSPPPGKPAPGMPRTLVVKTDVNELQQLDPVTLEPVALYGYQDLNREMGPGPLSAAHGQIDFKTGERVNFTMSLGGTPKMTVLSTTLEDPKGKIIASFTPPTTTYIHSFAMTDRFVVMPFWPYHLGSGLGIFWHGSLVGAYKWDPSKGTTFAFISRKHNRLVALYTAPAAWCFHTIDAYDAPDGSLVLTLIGYDDASLVRSTARRTVELGQARFGDVRRYVFPDPGRYDVPGTAVARVKDGVVPEVLHPGAGVELARFHPDLAGTGRLRWVYALAQGEEEEGKVWLFSGIKKMSIAKAYTSTTWSAPGLYPSEPIFVPRPGATEEDDGVLLTVCFDAARTSSALVVLDAARMEEVARCVFDGTEAGRHVVGFGFHGAFWNGQDLEY
ncbi:carotenoid oxygenase [Hyaloraphidium curvatum]|nr:carotenoid oxygenase [Hyaloraphidium curvatum]